MEQLCDRIVDGPHASACTRATGSTRRCRSTRPGRARSRVVRPTTTSRRSERRRLEAIGGASAATGAAILVHTEIGTAAHEIVDLLVAAGATTDRIALAHLDRNPDWELHAEVAARGVTLEYDTVGRTKYHPDSVVLDLIERVAGAGHLDRLVLGLDLGARSYLRAYEGGPGLRYLMTTFVPRLRRRIGEEATARILVANPARLYGHAPGR